MDGLQDTKNQINEDAAQQPQDNGQAQRAQTPQVTGAGGGNAGNSTGVAGAAVSGNGMGAAGVTGTDGTAAKARADFETALKERDAKIAELESSIADAAKTAESAEKLRAEMDELRRQGDEQRIGFDLQLAGARNVKAARALLADHDGDVEKLKAAEPWLFGGAAPAQTGATGLPSAGAAGPDGSAQLSRWRKIAGLPESEE